MTRKRSTTPTTPLELAGCAKCPACTTPTRCGATALHNKGPRCVGRADGKDNCDCLNACGDDPWLETGQSTPCQKRMAAMASKSTAVARYPASPEERALTAMLDLEGESKQGAAHTTALHRVALKLAAHRSELMQAMRDIAKAAETTSQNTLPHINQMARTAHDQAIWKQP